MILVGAPQASLQAVINRLAVTARIHNRQSATVKRIDHLYLSLYRLPVMTLHAGKTRRQISPRATCYTQQDSAGAHNVGFPARAVSRMPAVGKRSTSTSSGTGSRILLSADCWGITSEASRDLGRGCLEAEMGLQHLQEDGTR